MALPKVIEYTRNVSKSIVYSSAEALKNDMPALSAYMTNEANRQLSKSIYAGVKDYKTTMKKAKEYIVNNPFYEAGQDALKNAFDDIKTGKFYNKERIDRAEEAVGSALGWTMDDMGDEDFDFDMDGGWDDGIDAGDKLVATSTQVSAMKAADMVSQTTLQSADAIIKSNKASTRIIYNQNLEMIGSLKQLGFTTAQTQTAVVNLHDTMKVGVENSKTFFETTGKQISEISGMLKEMLEMQRNIYKANNEALEKQKEREKQKLHYDDIVGYEGELNISNYFKNISRNTKNAVSQATGGMFDTLLTMGGGEMLKAFTASPLSFISTALMKGITPAATRKAAKQLDKSIAGLASTLIARFNGVAANEDATPFARMLGNIFGVKTNIRSSFDTSQYKKGPVPFDGIVRKSIVDIIPSHLRRIEAALTGQQERIFNHANGKWTNMRAINEEWNNLKTSSKARATGDLVAEIRKIVDSDKSKFSSKYDVDKFNDALEAIMNRIYETGSFKKNKDDALAMGIDSDTYEFIANLITNASGKKADMYINQGMRNARIALANNVLSSRNELNKRIRQMEEDGDSVFFQLFNNSVDRSKLKLPKYEEDPIPMGGAMSLINQKDKLGHNIFWYLRNMYKELGIMRRSGGFGGSIGGSGAFDSSLFDFSIPDEHKKTNKERYQDNEEAVRRRYQELIEKHSQKGGSLYDLSKDAKGNIILANATQQQLNILEQLREEAETHGWINEAFYGNSTQLTKLNAKKAKSGGDLLDQDKFMDRMKATKNLGEKLAVMQDQVKNLTRKPGEWTTKILKKADQGLYDLMFGYETEDETNPSKKVRGFLGILQLKLNTTWDNINTAIEEKLINPLKKKLGVENMKDVLDKLGITPILDTFMNRVFGEKNADGKREGGILGETKNAVKDTFKKAGSFVKNSFQTVFDPITSRVKNAMANKASTKHYTVDPVTGEKVEIESPVLYINRKRNAPPRRATKKMYDTNPAEAFNADKEFLHDVINKYADIIELDFDPNTNMYMIMSYQDDIGRAQKADDIAKLRHIWYNTIYPQISDKISAVLDNNVTSAWDRMTTHANKSSTYKVILPNQVVNQRAINKSIGRHVGQKAGNFGPRKPGRVTSAANDMAKKFDEMFKFDRSDNGPGTQVLAGIIKELAINGEGDAMEALQNLTVGDLYRATSGNTDTDSFARFLSNKVKKDYNNRNIKVKDLLSGRTLNDIDTGGSGGGGVVRLLNNFNDILGGIFTHFKKITNGDTVKVVQTTPTYDGGLPFINRPRGPRSRSRRTQSSGASSGTVESSADGGYFGEDTISALSEGELYGKNGLFGRVPKTGLYDIKAGTTILPTNKDKFVEKANEQNVISKLYRKAGIMMNADASNAPTRTIDGKVYTRGEDGKWHHYESNPKGGQIHTVVEDGFLDRMRDTASSGVRGVMRRFGLRAAEKDSVENVDDAMKVIKKYAPKMTGNALLGAAIGLLAGNPLLGAAIGAGAGFVGVSDKAKQILFGDKLVDKDGNDDGRSGGLISREAQQWMKRNVPDMATYGTVGGILGLLTPFGMVGGAVIGAGIGLAKKSSAIQEALFGNAVDPRSGLISKNARDYMKKSAPNMVLGAGAGLLLGPFGLVGNLALGAGIGLLSTTEEFKSAIFGEEVEVNGKKSRVGGLVGTIKITVVDPLKLFAKSLANTVEDFIVNDMINPLKDAVKPIFREIKLLSTTALKSVLGILTGTLDKAFGRPLYALFRDRLILPMEKGLGGILGFSSRIAKGILGAPFHALGAIGNSLQMKHIRKGDASDMTAAERLQFRRDHRVRGAISNLPIVGSMFGSLGFDPRGYRDKFKRIDTVLADMNEEQLMNVARDAEALSSTPSKLRRKRIASSREIVRKLSEFFDTRDVKKIANAMKSKNIDLVNQLILTAKPIKGTQVSREQRAELTQEVLQAMTTIDDIERRQNKAKWNSDEMYKGLRSIGFGSINKKNIGKFARMAKTEYSARHYANMNKKVDPADPNASLINSSKYNTGLVVETLNEGFESIKDILTVILPDGKRSKAMKVRSQEFFKRNTAYAYDEDAPKFTGEDGKQYIRCRDGKWRSFTTDSVTGRITVEDNAVLGQSRPITRSSDDDIEAESEGESEDNANAPEGGKKKRRNPIKWIFDSTANSIRKFRMSKSGDYEEVNGRAKQNADRKEGENEQKKLNLFGKMWKLFFGEKDEETGEKEKGIIGKAFDGIKSIGGKFFGKLFKGLAIATAFAGAGHFGSFVKDTVFPKIGGWWKNSATPFLKEHFGNIYNGIMTAVDFIKEIPSNIVNFGKDLFQWVSGTGKHEGAGFPKIFSTKILPWYLDGFGKFAEVYFPPLISGILLSLPKVASSIITGLGIWIDHIFNHQKYALEPDLSANNPDANNVYGGTGIGSTTLSNIKSASGGSGWWNSPGQSLNSIFDSAWNGKSLDKDKLKIKTESENIINDKTSTKEQKQEALERSIENAKIAGTDKYDYNYMPTDKYGNHYDKDGNNSYDNANNLFNPFDGVTSKQDKLASAGLRYTLGVKNLATLGDVVGGLGKGIRLYGKGLSFIPGVKVISPLVDLLGRGLEAPGKPLTKLERSIEDPLGRLFGFGRSFNLGTMAMDAGNLLSKSGNTTLQKLGSKLTGSKLATIGSDDVFKKQLDKMAKDGLLDPNALKNTVFKNSKTGTQFITKTADDAVVKSGLVNQLKGIISKGFKSIFGSKPVVQFIQKEVPEVSEEVIEEVGENIAKKFISEITKKLAKGGAKFMLKVTEFVAKINPIAVAFHALDFVTGTIYARNILGLTESQPISFSERLLAGILKCINGFILFGFFSEDWIVTTIIDCLSPIFEQFGINTFNDIKRRREESLAEVKKYNELNGTHFSSVATFNQRNSLGNRIKARIEEITGLDVGALREYEKNEDTLAKQYKGDESIAYKIKAGAFTSGYGKGRLSQYDPSIANMRFNRASDHVMQNVRNSGCGPVAAYNAVNYAYGRGGNDIEAAVNLALDKYKEQDGGTQPGFFKEYFKSNGLSSRRLTGRNAILNSVSSGNPVIMMGRDASGGNTPYGVNPHYVTATGTDGKGNIIIDDPESMYGQAKYPISKVLGRTSMAIGTSRYGRASNDLFSMVGDTSIVPNTNITFAPKNPKSQTIVSIPNKSSIIMDSSPSLFNSSLPNMKGSLNLMNNVKTNMGNSLRDKPKSTQHHTCFTYCGFKDRSFGWLNTGDKANLANNLATLVEATSLGARDYSSMTIGSIFNKLGFNLTKYYNAANRFGEYVDMPCSELKDQSADTWALLNYYASDFGFNIRSADKDTLVGSITSSMGITYDGNLVSGSLNNTDSGGSSSGGLLYDTAMLNMESNVGSENSGGNESIFSMLGKLVKSLFSYTDKKTGEKKNLLDFFGIGGGSTSTGSTNLMGNAVGNTASQLTGVMGNMANGFPYFSQSDPAWGSIGYGKSGTIASSGCGPTSMAMILKSFGANDITPKDTAAWSASNGYRIVGSGTSWDYFKAIGKQYGLTTEQSGESQAKITQALSKGYPIITSMKPGDFTKGGHFIVLSGIDKDGNILVNDPSGSAGAKRSAIAWDPANITRQAKQMWVFNKNGVGSINGIQSASGVNTLGTSTTLKGNSVAEQIWNYLKSKGYSDIAAAGIMGNIAQECSYDPSKVEDKPKNNNPGLGICQWTYHTRKQKFQQMVPDWKTNLPGQLDFMWMEITTGYQKCKPETMNNCTSLEEAVTLFHNVYEQSADTTLTRRINFAQEAYANFAGRGSSSSTSLVSANKPLVGMGKNPIRTFVKNNYGIGYLKQSKYGRAVVPGGYISSTFNDPTRRSHNGIDIAGPLGSPVLSPVSGEVYRVDDNSTNGKLVVVRDNSGKLHTFSHMKSINVTVGARVSPGTLLGYLGNTGNSAGPHVHYSATDESGQYVDPSGGKSLISKRSNAGIGKRPIGGGEGLDYTVLIKAIIELLELMSKSSMESTSILKIISEKIGVDISSVDTSSNKLYSDIANKLRALDNASGGSSTVPRSNQLETERLVKIMTAIARD